MTYKEMNAAVMLLGAVVIGAWVFLGAGEASALPLDEAAKRLCWAILASIVFNIVAVIVFTILISIAQGRELKDERTDERDRAVRMRAMSNAYVVASLAGAAALVTWALGYDLHTGLNVLFGGLMLAGATDAVSRLYYYRIG